jgi:hypothetical protein
MRNVDTKPLFVPTDNPYRGIIFHSCSNSFCVTVGKTRFFSSLDDAMKVRDEMEFEQEGLRQ